MVMPKTIIEKGFEDRYKNLNPDQKKAVDTIEGPVLVIAGPGTGKTEILTLRIGNILRQTDTQPENILALTFTDAAAGNMRRRLSELIGPRAYRVNIETFHSFCNKVIKDYPEYFDTIIGSSNITEVESIAILAELINTLKLDILKPWGEPFYYIRDIYRKIEELKREAVTPEKFTKLVAEEERFFKNRDDLYHEKGSYKGKMKSEHINFQRVLEKNKELTMVYDAYQDILQERRFYDFSDMIIEVLQAMETHNDLKLSLQENYQYILVDEHQDTNNAQNKILEILLDFHKDPNIFIVGDEKQAIFRFQGASVENFNYFKGLYPKAKIITLTSNYRSGQNILDAAHSLIAGHAPLKSHHGADSNIKIAEFGSKNLENYFVAEEIKELVSKKIPPHEIAVIYRANKEAFPLAEALEKVGVKYVIESDEDLLSERYVRKFITILESIHNYSDDTYLVPLLHIEEFKTEPLVVYKMINEAAKSRSTIYDLFHDSKNKEVIGLRENLSKWVKYSKIDHLTQFLERILRESGLLDSMISSRDAEAFLGIERLFEEAKRISTNRPGAGLTDFMNHLNIIRERKLFIKRPKHYIARDAVRLMTAHRSKGLEFEYVFIINATEYSFGEKSDRDPLKLVPRVYTAKKEIASDSMGDERRLFYVALTRAKKEAYISYSSFDENSREILPSPFVLEIRSDRKVLLDTKDFESRLRKNPKKIYAERTQSGALEIDKKFVTDLFNSYPMSVTALNNYLSCPWKYFYRNLLRIPQSPEKHQIYGIAMHAAVESLWKNLKEKDPNKNFLLNSYKRELGLLGILNEKEHEEALLRGEKALSGWFNFAQPKITNPVISEFRVSGVDMDGIVLGGKLDLVEIVGGKKVIVTDYKTGKPKSRNYIEGGTREKNKDMRRQLEFYKLILSLHDGSDMQKGVIEFLEPNDSGKYSKEEFVIDDNEVKELRETIKKSVQEIKTLYFWDKTCNDKDCQYCAYRRLLA